jgi:DNA invertase Pin-like site-specific DNA recombinase
MRSIRRVIAYMRVSSREQGKSGIGLEVQRARIQAFAEASGFQIVRIYEEVASAIGGDTLKDRPQLRAALKHARRLGCPVAITQLDRLTRATAEIEQILSGPGADIIAVRKHPDSLIRMKTEAAGIQKQTELLKQRTREGIKRAKDQGIIFGNRKNLPEAQKRGAQANRNAAKARQHELAPTIARIRAEGVTSGAEIADRLNQLGKRTPRGKDWTDANIRRVIRDIDRDKKARKKSDAGYQNDPKWRTWG